MTFLRKNSNLFSKVIQTQNNKYVFSPVWNISLHSYLHRHECVTHESKKGIMREKTNLWVRRGK